jgi:hypothetical protein
MARGNPYGRGVDGNLFTSVIGHAHLQLAN